MVIAITGIVMAQSAGGAASTSPQSAALQDSVFDAELMKVLVQESGRGSSIEFPSLSLTMEYSRHRQFEDQPVYSRGPYDLDQQIFRSSYSYNLSLNSPDNHAYDKLNGNDLHTAPPATASIETPPGLSNREITIAPSPVVWYVGAMEVRGARIGDAPAIQDIGNNYLIRAAVVPIRYVNDTLWVTTILQRAVLPPAETATGAVSSNDVKNISVVYKKRVDIYGKEPVILQLPPIAEHDETEEDITLTLEPPQGYGLAKNVPDPVTTGAMFAYAVPQQSTILLTVANADGSAVDTLAHGRKEAGVYRSVWHAEKREPGSYFCSLEATGLPDGATFYKQIPVTKSSAVSQSEVSDIPVSADSVMERFPVATINLERQRVAHIFRVLLEGGASYTEPVNPESPFDDMFAHAAVGIGFSVTSIFETGILFGQDGFHRQRQQLNPYIIPSASGSIETYTVPWVGGYGRLYFAEVGLRGFVHASFAAANGGLVTVFGIGALVPVSSGLAMYLMPMRTDQWQVNPSTKWGAEYGIEFYF